MTRFEVGKNYECRSICDHNCVWRYKVTKRTACMVTLEADDGEVKKCRIIKGLSEMNGTESVYPLGRYGFAPILKA